MTTVGVLCARVRVEEKELLAALAEAGLVPAPLAPAAVPLPVAPLPPAHHGAPPATLIVDRCQDRTLASAIIRVSRAQRVPTLDAGLAASADRLTIATALAAVRIARPPTRLAYGEEAATAALAEFGYPSTILPLGLGAAPIVVPDIDTAEAVLEHRAMLGGAAAALTLVQAGTPLGDARWTVVVVDGRSVAATESDEGACPSAGLALAEAAAAVLQAGLIGVEIAATAAGLVVWDVAPVPEYRHAVPLGPESVAAAAARAVAARLELPVASPWPPSMPAAQPPAPDADWTAVISQREVRDGVPLGV